MVSPQVLLGIGVGGGLALIGAYVLWLERRLDELERRTGATGDEGQRDEPDR